MRPAAGRLDPGDSLADDRCSAVGGVTGDSVRHQTLRDGALVHTAAT